jgi:hypothetical protein
MKRFLLAGAAIAAISAVFPGAPAFAAGNNSENLLQGSRYMAPNAAAPAQTQAAPAAPNVEPQAGNESGSWSGDEADYTRNTRDRKMAMGSFNGPYFGGEVGYTMGDFDVNNPSGPDGDVGMNGTEENVFIGYGFAHNPTSFGGYVGIEAAYGWSGADGEVGPASFKKDRNMMITLRPGVTMGDGDSLAYGIVGYNRAKFEADSANDDRHLNGLVLGAGTELGSGPVRRIGRFPVKLRLEYNYINYGDTTLGGASFDGHESAVKAGLVFRL